MIAKIVGKLVEKRAQSVIVNVQGLFYEVIVPATVLHRISESDNGDGDVQLITYHYFQMNQSSAVPMLIGFINEIELDFFKNFIKVSGIGPKAAVKALNKPISEIVQAIDAGDYKYLKTLQGIGERKAKEIIAKLQGRIGKFGLIQDKVVPAQDQQETRNLKEEALSVLMQLQYKKTEARDMIDKALKHAPRLKTSEELLSEIYKQKVKV
jgi:Holliday junction DNA helicase RuvA